MVMPCSRSADSPSTSNAKSIFSPCVPCRLLSASSAASWSSNNCRVSNSSRPIRVDLPSSTLPHVMKRSSSLRSCSASQDEMSAVPFTLRHPRESGDPGLLSLGSRFCGNDELKGTSKIALLLLLLHRCAAAVTVDGAALPLAGRTGQHFGNNLLDACRVALDCARQRITAQCPEPHPPADHLLAGFQPHPLVVDHQDEAVALHRWPLRREVQRHDRNPLAQDVLPHVELGPVGQGEDAHALTLVLPRIVQRPQLRPLAL